MPRCLAFSVFALALAVCLLVLLSGCLGKEAIEERRKCVELASASFAVVPQCSSQEDCFSKVQSSFVGFDERLFSAETQNALHSYENHVARSWLYFNEALKNLRLIRQACADDSYLAYLPGYVNNLNFELRQAFKEVDAASKESFSILLLEQGSLQKQGIELIREEPLFDDFIEINNNLNELQNTSTSKSSDSYVSFYFKAMNNFNSISSRYGFNSLVLEEKNIFDLAASGSPLLIKEAGGRKFYIPFISNAVSSILGFFANLLKLQNSVDALKGFPSFEFLSSYNELIGTNASVVQRFFSLLGSNALHRSELLERNSRIEQQLSTRFEEIEKKIAALDESAYAGFDQNFFSELYSLLGTESTIAVQQYSLQDISSIKKDASAKLFELRQALNSLKEKDFFRQLSLGEKANSLKKLLASASGLNSNLDFVQEELLTGLEKLCTARIESLEAKTKALNLEQQEIPLLLLDLKAKLDFYFESFSVAKTREKRLYYCQKSLESFNAFKQAAQGLEDYEAKLKAGLQGCFNELERLFPAFAEAPADLLLRFNQLKRYKEEFDDASMLQKRCLEIKADLEALIEADPSIQSFSTDFFEAQRLYSELKAINEHYPETVSSVSLQALEKRFAQLQEYFSGGKLLLADAAPLARELSDSATELLQETRAELKQATLEFFKASSKTQIVSPELPELGKPFSSRLQISFSNPFSEAISEPAAIRLPINGIKEASLSNASPNVLNAKIEAGELVIDLNSIPVGTTFLEFDVNSTIEAQTDSRLLFADATRAVIEKTISFSQAPAVQRLLVSLPLEGSAPQSLFVFFNEKQLPFWLEGSTLNFVLKGIQKGSEAKIYYTMENPIQLSLGKPLIEAIDQNTLHYSFEVKAENLLPFSLENIKMLLPFDTPEKFSSAKLFDSSGRELQFSMLPDGISFSLPELAPRQAWQGTFSFVVKDASSYWREAAEKTKAVLEGLSLEQARELSEPAQQLLSELNSLVSLNDFKSDSTAQRLVSIVQQANSLLASQTAINDTLGQLSFLRDSIQSEISSMEQTASNLSAFGYAAEANALNQKIFEAKKLLADSSALGSLNDYNAALALLFKAKSLAIAPDANKAVFDSIERDRNALLKETVLLASKAQDFFPSDSNLAAQTSALFALNEEIGKAVSFNSLSEAKEGIDTAKRKLKDLNSAINDSVLEKVFAAQADANLFLWLLSEQGIAKKIKLLGEQLDSVTDAELIVAKYVPPISKKRLERMLVQLESLRSIQLEKRLLAFNALIAKKNFAEAFQGISAFELDLKKKLEGAQALDTEAENALNRLKEDAIIAFNSAKSQSSGNPIAAASLNAVEKEIEKESWLKAIVLAKKQSAQAPTAFVVASAEVPIAVYPLLACIAAAAGYRYWRKRQEKENRQRYQRLLRLQ